MDIISVDKQTSSHRFDSSHKYIKSIQIYPPDNFTYERNNEQRTKSFNNTFQQSILYNHDFSYLSSIEKNNDKIISISMDHDICSPKIDTPNRVFLNSKIKFNSSSNKRIKISSNTNSNNLSLKRRKLLLTPILSSRKFNRIDELKKTDKKPYSTNSDPIPKISLEKTMYSNKMHGPFLKFEPITMHCMNESVKLNSDSVNFQLDFLSYYSKRKKYKESAKPDISSDSYHDNNDTINRVIDMGMNNQPYTTRSSNSAHARRKSMRKSRVCCFNVQTFKGRDEKIQYMSTNNTKKSTNLSAKSAKSLVMNDSLAKLRKKRSKEKKITCNSKMCNIF